MTYDAEQLDEDMNLYAVDGNVHRFAVDKLTDTDYGVSLGVQFDEETDEVVRFAYTQNTHPSQEALIADRMDSDTFQVTRIYGDRHPAIRLLNMPELGEDWEFLKGETEAALSLPDRPETDYTTFLNAFEGPLTFLTNLYDVAPDASADGDDVYTTKQIRSGDLDVEPLSEDELLEDVKTDDLTMPQYDADAGTTGTDGTGRERVSADDVLDENTAD